MKNNEYFYKCCENLLNSLCSKVIPVSDPTQTISVCVLWSLWKSMVRIYQNHSSRVQWMSWLCVSWWLHESAYFLPQNERWPDDHQAWDSWSWPCSSHRCCHHHPLNIIHFIYTLQFNGTNCFCQVQIEPVEGNTWKVKKQPFFLSTVFKE